MEFLIGIFVGALLYWVFGERKKISGTFVIDFRDPMNDEPFRLEMKEGINEIYSKKHITLKVEVHDVDSLN